MLAEVVGGVLAGSLALLADAGHMVSDFASLLLACARLCIRAELYGKARSYLETSLAIRPDAETCEALGQLMQRLGDKEGAAKAFQRGLALVNERAEPPRLERPAGQAASDAGIKASA